MFTIFLIMIWLHLFGDYVLQNEMQAMNKGKNDFILFVHCALWTGVICFGLYYFSIFAWWKLVMLLIGHFVIDRWKARKVDKTYFLTRDLWIDQFLHVIQIAICLI